MADTIFYFAYGSNMHFLRLKERVPSCEVFGIGELPGHRLCFHKRSDHPTDGSGKCNIIAADSEADAVRGVVYRFPLAEKRLLDHAEGEGYEALTLQIETGSSRLEVYTYRARPSFIQDTLKPYTWYRELVVQGARYHGLPESYTRFLASTAAQEDHDSERAARHFLLARSTVTRGQ